MSSYNILCSGGAGSGKSTFALSGDGITSYFEFDPGSYDRAMRGSTKDPATVRHYKMYAPLTNLLELGKVNVGQMGGVASATAHSLKGWLELYADFVEKYLTDLQDDQVNQVIIDTETRMWLVIRQAFLQQVQEAQASNNKQEADRLGTLQYTEPNARYEQIGVAAKMFEKPLIYISHLKEEWKGDKSTGRLIHDGQKEAPNNADLYLHFAVEDRIPVATIEKAGAGGLELIGMRLTAPTLQLATDLLDAASAIRRQGLSMPEEPGEIIELGAALATA